MFNMKGSFVQQQTSNKINKKLFYNILETNSGERMKCDKVSNMQNAVSLKKKRKKISARCGIRACNLLIWRRHTNQLGHGDWTYFVALGMCSLWSIWRSVFSNSRLKIRNCLQCFGDIPVKEWSMIKCQACKMLFP